MWTSQVDIKSNNAQKEEVQFFSDSNLRKKNLILKQLTSTDETTKTVSGSGISSSSLSSSGSSGSTGGGSTEATANEQEQEDGKSHSTTRNSVSSFFSDSFVQKTLKLTRVWTPIKRKLNQSSEYGDHNFFSESEIQRNRIFTIAPKAWTSEGDTKSPTNSPVFIPSGQKVMTEPKIWTSENDMKTHFTPPSTTTKKTPSISNHVRDSYLVGVESKFRRKNYHKVFFCILILIILLLASAIVVISWLFIFQKSVCYSHECLRAATTFLQNMDLTVDPCEDFFQFTCGRFEDEHPRPDTQTSHDWFTERQMLIYREIRNRLQKPSDIRSSEPNPIKQVRKFYKSCMDTEGLDRAGFTNLFKYLNEYNLPNIPTMIARPQQTTTGDYKFDWLRTVVKVKKSLGADKIIGFDVFPDPKNRSMKYLAIGSPSQENGLPLVDDLLSKRMRKMRGKWKTMESDRLDSSSVDENISSEDVELTVLAYSLYMKEVILMLMKKENPKADLEDKETDLKLAIKATLDFSKEIYHYIELAENASKTYEKNVLDDILYMKVKDIQNITDSHIAPKVLSPVFERYFQMMFEGLPEAQPHLNHEKVLTSNGDLLYLKKIMELIAETPLVQIEMFLWWTVVEDLVLYTTSSMRQLYYDYSKMITNVESSQSRSSFCVGAVNKLMGMAVSYLIVDDTDFLTTTKPKVETMLDNIRLAFNTLVRKTTWMDYETQQKTSEKSESMRSLIGFPEWILNRTELEAFYKGIKIRETAFMDNVVSLLKADFMDTLSKWRLPPVFEWATAPSNVNAFHTFQSNTISIPIAILQYPFYHLGLEALNYGSIGTILGHELTHGFDDIGRQFDKEGNKIQWWTNQTVREYINLTECFVNQYNKYYLSDIGEYIDGEKTLGENIADNGGLREAYYAYKYYVSVHGNEQKLAGFESYTHDQLFFMAYGNVWCESMTPAALRFSLEDTHCPGRVRLLGTLSNSREFQDAFQCKQGNKMHKKEEERCIIW